MTVDSRGRNGHEPRRSQDSTDNSNLKLYYRLTKPGIVYSNVMTGAAGYLLASKWHVNFSHFISLLVGMALLIAGSCVLNNYLDRNLDAKMDRTSKRAIPAGRVSSKQAISYSAVLLILGFIILMNTNGLTLLIGALAVVFYVIVYGLAKRHSVYGTLVGALPGAASLVAGYTAYLDKFNFGALLLLLLMIAWQMPHFYGIAIYRLKDYSAAGLPLWPIKRGYPFLVAMVLASGYWLNQAYKNVDSSNQTVWAKKVFLCSLVVILIMSAMLPISRLIS
jgi:protoheme IX farnesyltransferase